MVGAVPRKGSWKTRPTKRARRCSGQWVMLRPAIAMLPSSTRNVPATALSRVDFPEPLVPMTIRNEPWGRLSETLRRARTSLGVPGLKVLKMRSICSIGLGSFRGLETTRLQAPQQSGHHESGKDEHRGNQFQVVGTESPAQGDGHKQAEEDRPHDRAGDKQADRARAHQRFADNHAGDAQ